MTPALVTLVLAQIAPVPDVGTTGLFLVIAVVATGVFARFIHKK